MEMSSVRLTFGQKDSSIVWPAGHQDGLLENTGQDIQLQTASDRPRPQKIHSVSTYMGQRRFETSLSQHFSRILNSHVPNCCLVMWQFHSKYLNCYCEFVTMDYSLSLILPRNSTSLQKVSLITCSL